MKIRESYKCFTSLSILVLSALVISLITNTNVTAKINDTTIVERYGQLRVEGNKIVNHDGNPVALQGMSLSWSQWEAAPYYNYDCVKWLRDDWKCTVVRASMGIAKSKGGYLANKDRELSKIVKVIDACIDLGIYVIVDWHDHNAHEHESEAIEFFKEIATIYGDSPNIIYEIFNEPLLNVSWPNVIKPYAETVIEEIRSIDTNNIIIVGTPTWSQDVDKASNDPLSFSNIAYALHFYAATHKDFLRRKAEIALNNGIALFVSEFGTTEASGTGVIDYTESEKWFSFMDENNLSWCNWSIVDKDETSAALKSGASATGNWSSSDLTASGTFVRDKIISYSEIITSVEDQLNNIYVPKNFFLNQNYPNPFNPTTKISYGIPAFAGITNNRVVIKVYDVIGNEIATLVNELKPPGNYEIDFNADKLTSGIYYYTLSTGNFRETKKMILLK